MLGSFAVGKTSLVRRFVQSIYSDKYHTTVGVKIDKKVVNVGDQALNLLLWDIQGEEDPKKLKTSYLRGASGYLLVADGTRRATLGTALMIHQGALEAIGPVPFVVVVNKSDLLEQWDIDDAAVETLKRKGSVVINTSAKTGEGVEEAFLTLARKILEA